MVEVRFDKDFKRLFKKLPNELSRRVIKQIKKISENPEVGKPMRNVRNGTRELYIKPFRLSYEYHRGNGFVVILDLYHKKFQ
jgi:mRNA-degrading endonuclease RelE of RelBE toxin-antitoxin system